MHLKEVFSKIQKRKIDSILFIIHFNLQKQKILIGLFFILQLASSMISIKHYPYDLQLDFMIDFDSIKFNNFNHSYFCKVFEMTQLQSTFTRQILRVSKKQAFNELNSLLQSSVGINLITLYEERQTVGPTLKEIEEAISQDFTQLNQLIQEAQQRFEVRLHRLQTMMVNVVTEELQEMRKQIKVLSQQLSFKIALNQENEEITYLRNQLDYFKSEALKLFQQNKQMRIQVKLLKKSLMQYEISLQAQHEALKKSKKKQIKEKIREEVNGFQSNPLREFLNGEKNKTFKIAKTKNGKTQDTEFRMKTQIQSIQQISKNVTRPISKSLNHQNIYSSTFYPRSKQSEFIRNNNQQANKPVIYDSFTSKKAKNSLIINNLNQILHPGPQTPQMLQNRVRKMRMRQQQNQRPHASQLKTHNRTYTQGGKQKGFFQFQTSNYYNSKMFQRNGKDEKNQSWKDQLISVQIPRKQSLNNQNKGKNKQQSLIFYRNKN